MIIAITGFFFWYKDSNKNIDRSNVKLSPDEILLLNVSLEKTSGGYAMSGQISNLSTDYTLKRVKLKILFNDCKNKDDSDCVTVSEENENIDINIPPGHTKDLNQIIHVRFNPNDIENMTWSYKIESVR